MTTTWIERLRSLVAAEDCLEDVDSLAAYGRDWTTVHRPSPSVVVLPRTLEQVVAVVRLAHELNLAIVPSGGRTGLSGGAVAASGEIVLALDRMNRLLDFDPVDRSLTVEAGMLTGELHRLAADRDLHFPVDFASRESSQIGGNVVTNAGGIRVLRYGAFRDWVTGLKVVTGTGEVLELNRGLIKNATGYDLRHLFIGSEGTLGIVVEATLRLTSRPKPSQVYIMASESLASIERVFLDFRHHLPLSAFEFFDDASLRYVVDASRISYPLEVRAPYYALAEFEAAAADRALELFEASLTAGWLLDGVASQGDRDVRQLWHYREGIAESMAHVEPHKLDVSVRQSRIVGFLEELEATFHAQHPGLELALFGHFGDGNIHGMIARPPGLTDTAYVDLCADIDHLVHQIVRTHEGSVSAEHGVGLLKKPFLAYTRSPEEIELLRGIKRVFDPKGIMNPGKMVDL